MKKNFTTPGATYWLLATAAKDAPTIRFMFRKKPEDALEAGKSLEVCNYVRAIESGDGKWLIIGLLESEARKGELAPVFQVPCRDEDEMQLAISAILDRFLSGTIGELLV